MRTAEGLTRWFTKDIPYTAKAKEIALKKVREFEKEIRRDQVNKCAKAIDDIRRIQVYNSEAQAAIKSTIED